MQINSIIIIRSQKKIKGNLGVNYSGLAQISIYDNSAMQTAIYTGKINLQEGSFEMNDSFIEMRIFVKLTLKQDIYLGSTRHVRLDSLYNLRDLGGYQGNKGFVKWGVLYRSDALDHLNKNDLLYLKRLSVDTVVDFRSSEEIDRNPDLNIGEQHHYAIDPKAFAAAEASKVPNNKKHDQERVQDLEKLSETLTGRQKLKEMQSQMIVQMHDMVVKPISQKAYALFLQVVLNSDGPLIFHCQGGKDRTGWAAVILLRLLGINKDTIMQDYLLTKKYNKERNIKRMASYEQYTDNELVLNYLRSLQLSKPEYLESSFKALESLGTSIEDYVKKYLSFTAEEIKRLQDKYLEK